MRATWVLAAAVLACTSTIAHAQNATRPPNVVVILADDLGYGDLGCFGGKKIRTPNLDRMAREGMRFTSFYVTEAVCSPSRASLLTGCYAVRVGLEGALNPTSRIGIHRNEVLLSNLCKNRGYATALFGKWHLGHLPTFSPLRRGFDEYFGVLYPNDSTNQFHPIVRNLPPYPLMDGDKAIAFEPDQAQFTRQFTERSLDFIARNKDRPFFLYLAHVMPHVPVHASEKFKGKSAAGIYGDAVEELDWSVGEVLAALKKHGIDENTLVVFTSDNGPFLSYGLHAGSAGPLRGGKLTSFEGGVRMPCLMRWPGKIPAGRDCDEVASTIDLVPTVSKLIGVPLSTNVIDGKDIEPLMCGVQGAKSPHEAFFFFNGPELHAVRSGKWKLHFPHPYFVVDGEPGKDGKPANWGKLKPDDIKRSDLRGVASRHGYRVEQGGLELYDLDADIGESRDVAKQHPEIVARLTGYADRIRGELGDRLIGRAGTAVRRAESVDDPQPPASVEKKRQTRLFVLSGQSNMAGLKPELSFTPEVTKAFPGDEILVVKDAAGGQPIRRWLADWKAPPGSKLVGAPGPLGDLYVKLLTKTRAATKGKTVDSAVFVWMQGERDAKENHGAGYEADLRSLVSRLGKDLGRDDLRVVIGRLSDFRSGQADWDAIRDVQRKVGESGPRFGWVDTDDLNGPKNDLHYTKDGYIELGRRFAHKSAELLRR